jgi:AGZA family xanthine/uracil permease-like MFS transporter
MLTQAEITRTQIRTEAIAGVTTFFTMAYIIVVNPAILSTEGTGMPFSGVLTATVLLSFLLTLFMGVYANLPFAVAPGMGINAFFTFTIILGRHVPWPAALGMVFWAGLLFVLISVTPIRVAIAQAIPTGLRTAAAAGIGIFLCFIGLKNAGFVVADPVTFVKLGPLDRKLGLSLVGLVVTVWMMNRKSPFAFLSGIFVVTALAWGLGWVHTPERVFSAPDFQSVFFRLDPWGALKLSLVPSILSILFTDLFDSISTFIGVSVAAGLVDEKGDPKNLKEGLIVDAFATLGAGLMGTSSGTAYIESSAGVEMGGRTGLTAVFTALCFLPFFFLAPLVEMVPPYATAPVLVLVGAFMFRNIAELKLGKMEDNIPIFLTTILIPLTFSITQGILWGFISHVGLYYLAGRRREVSPAMVGLSVLSIALLAMEHLNGKS